jgi:tetratricopeptide (TPR) repeat protein
MDNLALLIVLAVAAIILYRIHSWRLLTPKARVAAMLRRYQALARSGLSEQQCLLQLLATRRDWKRLPHGFLAELVSRLGSKEDLMRFVSVSEDYRYHREHYPLIATKNDLEEGMTEIACLFARFGFQLQGEGRYKEAEFVQKLALKLQPDQYFTNLPLAATYHETGQDAAALPLFEQGLAQLKKFQKNRAAEAGFLSAAKCLGPDVEIDKLQKRYEKMYESCRKAAAGEPRPAAERKPNCS